MIACHPLYTVPPGEEIVRTLEEMPIHNQRGVTPNKATGPSPDSTALDGGLLET